MGTFPALLVVVGSLALGANAQLPPINCVAKIPSGRVTGHCISIRECDYFMKILLSGNLSQSDRNLLRDNQCGVRGNDVQVCCPSTAGLGALTHPLLPSDCGRVRWQRLNDTDTRIREFPWLALIEYTRGNQEKIHACGGVLISDRYVLTAAHCVAQAATSNLQITAVRLGEWDTSTNPDCQYHEDSKVADCAPPYQDIAIEELLPHPLYNRADKTQINDIALIRLASPAKLNDFVEPICLPYKQLRADELEGLVTEVAGWQASSSQRMRKGYVTISSIEECQRKYASQQLRIQASQLCGLTNSHECYGNAGGPLMLFKNEGYLLGGLVSFGPVPCPNPDWPDVYTRVASYIDWIHDSLKA
ncbi:serine protease easter [Drosophila sechellia]|uniref:CLIP domain-containing serine protease n=1 Tax=Drosophila sechellia TaxID=7238 RepID=B4HEK3_DROSE|nr:serine protease easter [Drosophila sechellia]EDW42160.1 GM24177 [Drosophila sechellia]